MEGLAQIEDVALAFTDPQALLAGLASVRQLHQAWRGELALVRHAERGSQAAEPLPVGVRVELVPGRDGRVLGSIIVLTDLSDSRRADAACRHLEQALQLAARGGLPAAGGMLADNVIGAILTNASLAAMDIADSTAGPSVAPLLEAGGSLSPACHRAVRPHPPAVRRLRVTALLRRRWPEW